MSSQVGFKIEHTIILKSVYFTFKKLQIKK